MTLEDILIAYSLLKEEHNLPEMEVSKMTATTKKFDGHIELQNHLSDFEPESGWLCFQSLVCDIVRGEPLRKPDTNTGVLLCGESVNEKGESLHLRQDGRGGWLATLFQPRLGMLFLADQVEFIAHGSVKGNIDRRLRYKRYWAIQEGRGLRQHAACFIGYSK